MIGKQGIAIGVGGVTFTELAGNENHGVGSASVWEDYDLSAIIGAGAVAVLVLIVQASAGAYLAGVRKNGSALVRSDTPGAGGFWSLVTECDTNRIIECYSSSTSGIDFCILGYWS